MLGVHRSTPTQHWQAIDGVYADNGYSGGNLQRPALRRLLNDMQSDQIDVVVVHRFDRLSRSIFDLETLLPLFTIPGIRLVSVTQPLDTESLPTDWMAQREVMAGFDA